MLTFQTSVSWHTVGQANVSIIIMKYFHLYKKISICICIALTSLVFSNAATFVIESPIKAPPNGSAVAVRVYVVPEGKVLSGISGNFSFPSTMFDIDSISTESSVVLLWVQQPVLSEEKYLDGRTHVTFEGIFPGGYAGVRSPYYFGIKPGIVFTILLRPKQMGIADIVIDDVKMYEFTSDARELSSQSVSVSIENPASVEGSIHQPKVQAKEVISPTLIASIEKDPLISSSAWYLMVHEREQKSPIQRISIVESNEYHASLVSEYDWRSIKVPYILRDQSRTKYVHVKVEYANNTYAFRTIAPVENYQGIPVYSRILISVALVLLVLYLYVIYFISSKKNHTNQE
jgi:hypothetical protein